MDVAPNQQALGGQHALGSRTKSFLAKMHLPILIKSLLRKMHLARPASESIRPASESTRPASETRPAGSPTCSLHITRLPEELLLLVMAECHATDVADFYCLARTCRLLQRLSYDKSLAHLCTLVPGKTVNPHVLRHSDGIFAITSGNRYANPPLRWAPPWRGGDGRNLCRWCRGPRSRAAPAVEEAVEADDDARDSHSFLGDDDCCFRRGSPLDWGAFQSSENIPTEPSPVRSWFMSRRDQTKYLPIAKRMLRDALCAECRRLRAAADYRDRVAALFREAYCHGCQQPHARLLFDSTQGSPKPQGSLTLQSSGTAPLEVNSIQDSHSVCIGHTGRLRLCPHRDLAFADLKEGRYARLTSCTARWQASSHRDGGCPECVPEIVEEPGRRTTSTMTLASGQVMRCPWRIPRNYWAFYPVAGLGLPGDSLDAFLLNVKAYCAQPAQGRDILICPHWKLGDPVFVAALLSTLESAAGPMVPSPVKDFSGEDMVCSLCKTRFLASLSYTPAASSWRSMLPTGPRTRRRRPGPWRLGIATRRDIQAPHDRMLPASCWWLNQLDPSTFSSGPSHYLRSEATRGITWCGEPACATTRNRRKEAIVLRLAAWIYGISEVISSTSPQLKQEWAMDWFVTHLED